jgi:hypothetical protein
MIIHGILVEDAFFTGPYSSVTAKMNVRRRHAALLPAAMRTNSHSACVCDAARAIERDEGRTQGEAGDGG